MIRQQSACITLLRISLSCRSNQEYGARRAALISMDRAQADVVAGQPLSSSDTVYFAVVDGQESACSFIV